MRNACGPSRSRPSTYTPATPDFTRVSLAGRYDAERTFIVGGRQGRGVQVVSPLHTQSGVFLSQSGLAAFIERNERGAAVGVRYTIRVSWMSLAWPGRRALPRRIWRRKRGQRAGRSASAAWISPGWPAKSTPMPAKSGSNMRPARSSASGVARLGLFPVYALGLRRAMAVDRRRGRRRLCRHRQAPWPADRHGTGESSRKGRRPMVEGTNAASPYRSANAAYWLTLGGVALAAVVVVLGAYTTTGGRRAGLPGLAWLLRPVGCAER